MQTPTPKEPLIASVALYKLLTYPYQQRHYNPLATTHK